LAATVLSILDPEGEREFGQGTTLLDAVSRPICVETGIWFWPGRPLGLAGKRLDYPGISELLELEPKTREMVLRSDLEREVESSKERGLLLGRRLYREQLTPSGLEKEIVQLDGPDAAGEDADLAKLFQERCVAGDGNLRRLYDAVVFERRKAGP
ncbi:MAG TPA: hypothetical protein VJ921_13670, partial [Vicinamibacteria bacterium]|nr:hypothetical protein [Vicinamibacteria bacterium]